MRQSNDCVPHDDILFRARRLTVEQTMVLLSPRSKCINRWFQDQPKKMTTFHAGHDSQLRPMTTLRSFIPEIC